MVDEIPNPGSDDAIDQGCICPVLDNAHGKGYYGDPAGTFVMVADCPLHGIKARAQRRAEDADTPAR